MSFWEQVVLFVNEDLDQADFKKLLEWTSFWLREGGFWLFPRLAGYLGWERGPLPFEEVRGELSNRLSALQIQYDVAKELFEQANPKEKKDLLLKDLQAFQVKCRQLLTLLASSEKALLHLERNGSSWLKKDDSFIRFLISGLTVLEIESQKRPIPLWLKSKEIEDPIPSKLEDNTGVLALLYDKFSELDIDYLGFCPVCFKIFWKSRKDKVFCQRKCQSLYFVRRARMRKKLQKEGE